MATFLRPFTLLLAGIVFLPAMLLSQAKLSVAGGTKFSFGNLYSSTKVQKDIHLRNIGKDTLSIFDLAASCGCTAAMISNNRIAPHDSGTLSIVFDATRFNGWVDKTVGFRTNDPALPTVSIAFSANIVRVYTFDPEYLMFKTVVDSPQTQEVIIKNIDKKAVKILSVKTSSDIISATVTDKKLNPDQETSLECALHPSKPGSYNGTIQITTDNTQLRVWNLRFFAFVKSGSSTNSSKK